MKLSKKIIVEAVKKETGLEDVDLFKYDGDYYWGGKASCTFDSANTYYRTLNHPKVDLSTWVDDFKHRVSKVEEETGMKIQEYIDSLDWNVF